MNLFEYAHNSPTNYVDPDGEFAISTALLVAWGITEIGLAIADAYSTGSTLVDPCASGFEKAFSAGLFLVGALAPGGGYSTGGKALSKIDDIGDVAKTFRNARYRTRILKRDVEAFRYSGGISKVKGSFLTTRQTVRNIDTSADAVKALNLPKGATATKLNKLTIPKGTEVFMGRIEGGAKKATQIYIRDFGVLR